MRINGETHYLWQAVDHEGEVLETIVTKRRDRKAALKFLRIEMKRYVRLQRLTCQCRRVQVFIEGNQYSSAESTTFLNGLPARQRAMFSNTKSIVRGA